jgi:hypothetical protein
LAVPSYSLALSLFNAAARVHPAAGNASASGTTPNAVAIATGVTATLTVAITMLKEWNSISVRRLTTIRNSTTLKSNPWRRTDEDPMKEDCAIQMSFRDRILSFIDTNCTHDSTNKQLAVA